MRTVLIHIEGAKRHRLHKLQLREGTRVSDILRHLKVPDGYVLAHASTPDHPFPSEAAIDGLIADGDCLIARSHSAAVGSDTAFTLSFSN